MGARRRLLDDIAKLATGTAGLVQGAGREAETVFRVRLERLLDQMDLVPREEFDVVRAMAVAAREENAALGERIERLEAAIQSPAKAPAKRRPRAKAAEGSGARTRAKATQSRKKPRNSAE